jgi:hypothetical protein
MAAYKEFQLHLYKHNPADLDGRNSILPPCVLARLPVTLVSTPRMAASETKTESLYLHQLHLPILPWALFGNRLLPMTRLLLGQEGAQVQVTWSERIR